MLLLIRPCPSSLKVAYSFKTLFSKISALPLSGKDTLVLAISTTNLTTTKMTTRVNLRIC